MLWRVPPEVGLMEQKLGRSLPGLGPARVLHCPALGGRFLVRSYEVEMSVRDPREENMGDIERRVFMKVTAAGGIAFSIGGAQSLLTANEARAQGGPPPPAGLAERRLLGPLEI